MAGHARIPRPEAEISFLTPSKKPPYHLGRRVGDRLDRGRDIRRERDREFRESFVPSRLLQKEREP